MAGFLLLGTPLRLSSTTAPALSYYRPSMDICVTLVRPPRMVDASGSCLGLVQPLSRPATLVCLDNLFC